MALNETPHSKENSMKTIAVVKIAAIVTATIIVNVGARVAIANILDKTFDK